MNRPKILVADNKVAFLNQIRQYLERNGYSTTGADNPQAARDALKNRKFDAAVLDMRMVNEEDPEDWTGLEIACDTAPDVPKIILTAYPSVRAVREALSPALREVPAAVNFLSKKEGFPAVAEAIDVAIDPIAVSSRKRLLASLEARNVFALSEAADRFGGDELVKRIRELLEADRLELARVTQTAEERAKRLNLYVDLSAWMAIGLIVVALLLMLKGRLAATTASLLATLSVSAVKKLFEGRAREAQKVAQHGFQRVVRLNWVHQMIEVAAQLNPSKCESWLERILEFMLSDGKDW